MNPEMRQAYNSLYYKRHKKEILERATTKITCQFCNRVVSNNNLQKHYTLAICTNTQAKNKILLDRQQQQIHN